MKHWRIIDLVRSFCIIVVIGVHYYSNPPFANPWYSWFWGRFCVNGIYGVYLFFVVSGFLITHVIAGNPGGLFKPAVLRFYIQRMGRLWPLLFLFVGFGLLVFLAMGDNSHLYREYFRGGRIYDFWFWLSILTFTFNWLMVLDPSWSYGIWLILWSLSIEEQFYFLYPLVLRILGNERRLSRFLFGLIAIALAWRSFFYFHGTDNDFIQRFPSIAKFDLIAIGILLYLVVKRYGGFLRRHGKTSALLCVAGLTLTLATYFGTRENDRFTEIFVPEALGFGLFLFLLGGLHLRCFEWKYLGLLGLPGKYCYGCYLLHPVIVIFAKPYLAPMGFFWGFVFLVALTTLVAGFSYHLFEMPLNGRIRRAFNSERKLPVR